MKDGLSSAKILVVDDKPSNLSLATSVLKPHYKKIFLANNGESAIRTASEIIPDVILLDIMMPDMSGFEVSRVLKSSVDTANIPIIFFTAKSSGEDYEKAFDVGGVDYITKPVNAKELLARVKTHLLICQQRDELKKMSEHVQKINEGLEGKVVQRTQQLAKVNQRLVKLVKVRNDQNKRLLSFNHIVSHNLRSHTANMQGLIALLRMEKPDIYHDPYMKHIQHLTDNLNDTLTHLNHILDIQSAINEKWQLLNLHDVVEQVVYGIGFIAQEAQVNIYNEIDTSVSLRTIPAYLESVVLNLLTNAIRYRSVQNNCFVKITARQMEQKIILSFEDNGLGIDLDMHRQAIFRLYKTFHGNKDAKGLGLFITKSQVEVMGGTITVNSKVNVGTTFQIELPCY